MSWNLTSKRSHVSGCVEILRRLQLPPVQLAPVEQPGRALYLAALQTPDRNDWRPLMDIWRRRFEEGLP